MSCLSRDTQSYLVNSRIKIYDINIATSKKKNDINIA